MSIWGMEPFKDDDSADWKNKIENMILTEIHEILDDHELYHMHVEGAAALLLEYTKPGSLLDLKYWVKERDSLTKAIERLEEVKTDQAYIEGLETVRGKPLGKQKLKVINRLLKGLRSRKRKLDRELV